MFDRLARIRVWADFRSFELDLSAAAWSGARADPDGTAQRVIDQHGECALCAALVGDNLVPDHELSGRLRALICVRCRYGLTCFADDPELLRLAAQYLERNVVERTPAGS
jgi:hypothetical protein